MPAHLNHSFFFRLCGVLNFIQMGSKIFIICDQLQHAGVLICYDRSLGQVDMETEPVWFAVIFKPLGNLRTWIDGRDGCFNRGLGSEHSVDPPRVLQDLPLLLQRIVAVPPVDLEVIRQDVQQVFGEFINPGVNSQAVELFLRSGGQGFRGGNGQRKHILITAQNGGK